MLSSLQLGTCHHATIPRRLGWGRKLREEDCAGVRGICSFSASAALAPFNPTSSRGMQHMSTLWPPATQSRDQTHVDACP